MADGGIKEPGYAAAAIAAGADTIMMGSEFARCRESAKFTERVKAVGDRNVAEYWGSASERTNVLMGNGKSNVAEGTIKLLKVNEEGAEHLLLGYRIGFGSAFSYGGALGIEQFRENNHYLLKY